VIDVAKPRPLALSLAAGLAGSVRIGTLFAAPVRVTPTAGELESEIERVGAGLRERYAGRAPAEIAELGPARELYRIFGIDPTKTRPSSEKLLRRVLQDKPLPRISNAVDLGNLLALRFLLPIGLFDSAKIAGDVLLRPGAEGEAYTGIAGQDVHLGGRPVLSDSVGPFGNPTADSRRTSVDSSTHSLWMTVFAPASLPVPQLEANLRLASESCVTHLAGPDPVQTETAVV